MAEDEAGLTNGAAPRGRVTEEMAVVEGDLVGMGVFFNKVRPTPNACWGPNLEVLLFASSSSLFAASLKTRVRDEPCSMSQVPSLVALLRS